MKKENYSDYVKMAYAYYAQCGCPDIKRIRELRLSAQTAKEKAEVSDLDAVARTLEYIKLLPDADIIEQCLKKVYFHKREPKRNDITAYVRAAADELYISETTAYRILRNCRSMTASFRGLRVEHDTINSFT